MQTLDKGVATADRATMDSELLAMLRIALLVAAFVCVFAFVSIFLAEGLHAASTLVPLP